MALIDYTKITPEEICNPEKFSNEDFVNWQRINKTVVPVQETNPLDTPEFMAKLRKAMGVK